MKQAIQQISMAITGLVLSFGLTLSSCEKAKTGPKGATGETGPAGPEAKTYIADLTYNTGDVSKSFVGITDYESDDAIICYLIRNSGSNLSLPATYEGIQYEIVDYLYSGSGTIGAVQVNTYNATDGYSSPWGGPWTLHYKIVHIKSSGLEKHPDLDLTNYEEVKATFGL